MRCGNDGEGRVRAGCPAPPCGLRIKSAMTVRGLERRVGRVWYVSMMVCFGEVLFLRLGVV